MYNIVIIQMFFFIIYALSTSVMKIVYKYDMEAYNGGYYHSYKQSMFEKEMDDNTKKNLLNKIHSDLQKKELLDSLLDPSINNNEKYFYSINNNEKNTINKYGIFDINKGGLTKDWDFDF